MYNSTDFYTKTVYGKVFTGQQAERRTTAKFPPDYPDIVAGPYYCYLVQKDYKQLLPPSVPYEHHEEVIKRVVEKYPQLKRYFTDEPMNMAIISDLYTLDKKTVYQKELCNIDDLRDHPVSRVHLPDDYIVPPTVQRISYRDPYQCPVQLDLRPKRPKPPPNNLKKCEITRRVMQVVTGDTEYRAVIGKLGTRIVSEELLGKFTRAERPNNWEIECRLVEFQPKKQDEGLCWKATQTSKRKRRYD